MPRPSNNYFQFKQFIVHQDQCAMKVTTDACVFGAVAADWIANRRVKPADCLDIGAGTGLISLMIAQQNDIDITAVEIDQPAAEQCASNFQISPWSDRLQVVNDSIQHFTQKKKNRYDIIVSNPPFFNNDLKSNNEQRDRALHSTELSLEELFACVDQLMHRYGSFFLLIPSHRKEEALIKAAMFKLFLKDEVNVRQTEDHDHFRTIMWLSRVDNNVITIENITIKENGTYSEAFVHLLKEYYLYL